MMQFERAKNRLIRFFLDEKHRGLSIFFLSSLIFTALLLFFNRRYDYIDDLAIRDYGKNDVAILFSANILRQTMAFLYRIIPTLPWYGILLYAAQYLVILSMVTLVIRLRRPLWYKLIGGCILLVLYIPFFMRASYNYSSVLPGAAATLCFFDQLYHQRRFHFLESLLYGLVFSLAFIFRRDGVKVLYVFLLPPVFAWTTWRFLLMKPTRRFVGLYLICLTAFALPVLAVQVLDEWQYQNILTPAEQFHRNANRSRSPYYGYDLVPAILKNRTLLDANGWNKNDIIISEYGMVFFDENQYYPDNFNRIFDDQIGLPQKDGKKDLLYNLTHFGQLDDFTWFNRGWIVWNETWDFVPYYAAMIAFALLAVWRSKTRWGKVFTFLFINYVYWIEIYMFNYVRLPRHVAVPPLVLFCAVIFFCMDIDTKGIFNNWKRKGMALVVAGVMTYAMVGMAVTIQQQNAEIPIKREQYFSFYRDFYERFGEDAFFFIRPQLYIEYFADPLGDQGPAENAGVLGVSSGAFSPLLYRLLEGFHLNYGYQVLPWMIDNPRAYFVSRSDAMISWMEQFFWDTYALRVQAVKVYGYSDSIRVYAFKYIEEKPEIYSEVFDLVDSFSTASITGNVVDEEHIRPDTITLDGQTRRILFAHPETAISYQLNVPAVSTLRFDYAMLPEVWLNDVEEDSDGVIFTVYVTDAFGRMEKIFDRYINPVEDVTARHWLPVEISLQKWWDQKITLTLETTSGPNGDSRFDWAVWGNPQIGQYTYFDFTKKFYLANPAPINLELLRIRRILVGSSYRNAIFEHADGKIRFPVHVLPDTQLDFSYGLDPVLWDSGQGDGVEFSVGIYYQETGYSELFSQWMAPQTNPADREWRNASVDLRQYAGEDVEIIFSTAGGHEGDTRFDWAYWIAPRLIQNMKLLP